MTAEHLRQLGSALLLMHLAAVVIVNMTPTPKDNEALDRYQRGIAFVYKLLEALAGVGPMAKR
ncbi:MAG: hypothetical protein FJ083_13900 [Cyanobacteria bacterium K_Offshore_surface_m2_239]|nr:hypothetical protein [Cyanobacteria bacterium K_Offshore_surface_m2_239]